VPYAASGFLCIRLSYVDIAFNHSGVTTVAQPGNAIYRPDSIRHGDLSYKIRNNYLTLSQSSNERDRPMKKL